MPDPLAAPEAVVWFDLFDPSEAEEKALEAVIGFDVPTRDEMVEIEDSARLYLDRGALYMTATLPAKADTGHPVAVPVTFVLVGKRLVTVRYDETRAFTSFPERAERLDLGCTDGRSVLMALLEAIVERLADILEAVARDVEALSREIFRRGAGREDRAQDYRGVLQGVGRQGDVVSHVLASLVTLERLLAFFTAADPQRDAAKEDRARLKSLSRDTRFLAEHATFLAQKVTFLLDATLGMISIQQNAIIKIFSVAAVIFLPPTLVASIYGMNFRGDARARLGLRLSDGARPHGGLGRRLLLGLQDPRLAASASAAGPRRRRPRARRAACPPGSGWRTPLGCAARSGVRGGVGDLVGDDLEARERGGAEAGRERDVGGVAAGGHEDAADARGVVAGVEGEPAAVEPDLEPGAEVHGIVDRRDADVAEIAGAVARGDVHAAAERDREVGEVAADAGRGPSRPP